MTKTLNIESLSKKQLKKIDNWLNALGSDLCWDNKKDKISTIGKFPISSVRIEKDLHGIYAILGNCSLKL